MENNIFKKNWILRGLIWGLFMFLALAIVIPLVEGNQLDVCGVLVRLLVWLAMGLVYGFTIHQIDKKKEK